MMQLYIHRMQLEWQTVWVCIVCQDLSVPICRIFMIKSHPAVIDNDGYTLLLAYMGP